MIAPSSVAAVAAGVFGAVLFMLPVLLPVEVVGSLGVLLAYFASLPLFLVALGKGFKPCILASAAGTVVATAITFSPSAAVTFAVVNALPALLVARLALQSHYKADGTIAWYPAGRVLTVWTLVGGLAFMVAVIGMTMVEGGLQGYLRHMLSEGLQEAMKSLPPEAAASMADLNGMVDTIALLLPSMMIISWFFIAVLNAFIAEFILVRWGRALRPMPSMAEMESPNWMLVAFALSGLAYYFAPPQISFAGLNLAILAATPLFFVGLSVIHAFAADKPSRRAIVWGSYTMICVFLVPALIVVLIGALEQHYDWRAKWSLDNNHKNTNP